MQFAHTIAMVRPAAFGFNEETAANNFFQDSNQKNNVQLQELALQQFDAMVLLLRSHDIDVLVLQDTATPEKPEYRRAHRATGVPFLTAGPGGHRV